MGKTKKIFIVKLLALAIFLILYGCSAEIDKSEIPNQEKENFIILHKNYDYFKSNTSLFNRLKNLDNLKSNVTSKNIQTEDFKIFTDNITYTKRPDKLRESYTFYIEKLNYASNKTIDNLILARNLGDEKFKAYIITYYFPDGIASQHNNFKITEFKEINSETFSIQNITSKKNCENTYEFNIIETAHKCYSGAHSGESQAGQCDGNGAPPYSTYQVVAYLTNSCGEGTTGGSTDGGPSGPGGGGGSGSGGGGGPAVDTGISLPPPCQSADCGVPILANEINDLLGSTLDYSQLEFLSHHDDVAASLKSFLGQNNTAADKSFVKQIIDVVKNDAAVDSKAFSFVLSAQADTKIQTDLDNNFLLSVDQYMDLDVASYLTADPGGLLWIQFTIECAVLRANHPDWSDTKIHWEASKGFVHITLDVFGLVPLFGEAADLINGGLYTIEGDGVNATLSYASAIPIVGWATAGTKIGLKVITTATGKTTLFLKITNGVFTFGSRSQLRKVLNITASGIQAHHIIPWAKSIHPAIQKAAKSGKFHMNEALNGIPLSTAIHNGSHAHYDNLVQNYLDRIPSNLTPEQAYNELSILITKIKTAIQNNPNIPINQLNF
ncbi:hypothetical protein D0809_15015 [Flavobacterium circumlabens]|uniref:HNH/ENDO VII superfamily nuclease n=1 Tax=Flavobacterium circumlabens TaxID=2133765 RepID=A0A4Y7UB68_9FLAO|nr:AHH domain-containing protein [Flavobacterium circumlabens]TCN56443.1 HNH/ENDO VII superfamily nuclease [Flavobacterium circumlabens]TEB43471.1 hypothetical protein D0809_15015 [Flavobacterium circumlabens]